MAERAAIFQVAQVGVETAEGGTVAATKVLSAMTVEVAPMLEVETFKPTGGKFPTVGVLNKDYTEITLGGPLTYTELVYPLSSLMGTAVISGAGSARTWTFDPGQGSASTYKSYTLEQGSGERAHKVPGCVVQTLNLEFTRDGCEMSGTMIGRQIEDGITLSAGATQVALVPISPTQVTVKIDPNGTAGLGTATALSRAISANWGISDRYGPVWALTGSATYAASLETDPTIEVKVKVEADATGMAQLPYMRAGSTAWVGIYATGPVIAGGTANTFTAITPVKWTDVSSFSDEDGVFAIEWTGQGVYDATWGKATQVAIVNGLTAL